MIKIKKQKVLPLYTTRWIQLLQKLIFTNSLFFISFLALSQSDTTFIKTIKYKNSSAPDTVVIERIKIKKEKVYYVKRDTILQVDTVVRIKTDTLVVYLNDKITITVGLSIGSSLDYDHTHYWNTHSDFYNFNKENTVERLNWNTEAFLTLQKKRWLLSFNSGLISYRDQIRSANTVNKLNYLTFNLLTSYLLLQKDWGHLTFGVGSGFKRLLLRDGIYINPEDVSISNSSENFLPTNRNLWSLTARLEAKISITKRFSFNPQLRYETHPTSITTVEHPILFWRDSIGVNISVGWEI